MNSTVKWVLILGGIAFLFRNQLEAMLGIAAPAAPAPQPSPAPTTTPAPTSPISDASGTKALILDQVKTDATYIANGGRLNINQWNFYYARVRGVPGPTSDVIGFPDASVLVSLDEYWNAMTAHGLSGLLGRIRGRR
jgi:hypothetical protein